MSGELQMKTRQDTHGAMIFTVCVVVLLLLLLATDLDARDMPERWYADHWRQSQGGRTEARNDDGTRTDANEQRGDE